MTFDSSAFMNAKFEARTEAVKVPELAAWFGDNKDPQWIVRGLTGIEYGKVNEAVATNKNIQAVIEKIVSEKPKTLADGIGKLILGPDVPTDIARRISIIMSGSVDPVCDLEMAKKLCEFFSVVFYSLTNKILELSGRGAAVGGLKPSGKTKK